MTKMRHDEAPQHIEIIPGLKSKPLFKSDAEYERFAHSYAAEATPALEQCRLAHARSERDSQDRMVD